MSMIDAPPKAAVAHMHRIEAAGGPTASRMRDDLGAWLSGIPVSATQRADILLGVYEALANAAEHAYRHRATPGTIAMQASYDPRAQSISVRVGDRGKWKMASINSADRSRGRGIALMYASSDRCSIDRDRDGTMVRLGYDLRV